MERPGVPTRLKAMTTLRTRRALAGAAALTLLGLGAISCSAGNSGESSDAGGSTAAGGAAQDAPAAAAPAERGPANGNDLNTNGLSPETSFAADGAGATSSAPGTAPADGTTPDPSLIKVGNVSLQSNDVAAARFDVQKVVDTYGGDVSESSTEVGKDGDEARARLVIRVPAADFEAALADLEGIGDLLSSNGSSQDVTTQVIDTGVRVTLQRRSIERISILLDRANSIRDIVNIERELSRREADLGSLEKRQAYLADQTSMGTLTVSIELPPVEKKEVVPPKKKDDKGFFSGLGNGWDAFGTATVNVLDGLGTVLPFAVLLLLIGVPLRLLLRRSAAHRPTAPSANPSA